MFIGNVIVEDMQTGAPIEGAHVKFYVGPALVADGYTDSYGFFYVGYEANAGDYYVVTVTKQGYEDWSKDGYLPDGWFNVFPKMMPKAYGPRDVLFVVFDAETMERLQGATVWVNDPEGTQWAGGTNADGELTLTLPTQVNYTYEVRKQGYEHEVGSFYLPPPDGTLFTKQVFLPKVYQPPAGEREVHIYVKEALTGNPLPEATMRIDSIEETTDPAGTVFLTLQVGREYSYEVTKEGYDATKGTLVVPEGTGMYAYTVYLSSERRAFDFSLGEIPLLDLLKVLGIAILAGVAKTLLE